MKVSFITTTLNEENTITDLLDGLNSQTKFPQEVIILDGGSKDGTLKKIFEFQKSKVNKLKIKLISAKGNRAKGRNMAIRNSAEEIIVCTDAGCIPHKDWIKNITKPFEDKDIDVVAGYYEPVTNNIFEKCLAAYTSVLPGKIDEKNFLPSSRSIAFKKSAWKKVNGYPDWLDTCEDLVFARELKRKGFSFQFARTAIVYWPQRKNIFEATKQFFNYAVGDGMAHFVRKSTPFLFGRYFLGLILLLVYFQTKSLFVLILIWILLINYLIWSIFKNYYYIKNFKALFWLPILQFSADFSVITGASLGYIKSLRIKSRI